MIRTDWDYEDDYEEVQGIIKKPNELNKNELQIEENIAKKYEDMLNTFEPETTDGKELENNKKKQRTQAGLERIVRKRNTFKDQHILSSEGISKIYETFPKIFSDADELHGKEGKILEKLINAYKEWAYGLFPGLTFEDLLLKTEKFGKTNIVQSQLESLRKDEFQRTHTIEEINSIETDDEVNNDVNNDTVINEVGLDNDKVKDNQDDNKSENCVSSGSDVEFDFAKPVEIQPKIKKVKKKKRKRKIIDDAS